MTRIVEVDPLHPDASIIQKAVLLMKRGGVVAFPTETLYGLGVNAYSEKAVMEVFKIKGRGYEKPIPILIDRKEALPELVSQVSETAKHLIEEFWPGGLTIIFEASPKLTRLLTGNTGKIGIRMSSNAVAHELVKEMAGPITATSANISGQKACTAAIEVHGTLADGVDLIIDGGETKGNLGSTIVDVTSTPAKIVRKGVVSLEYLKEYL